MTGDLKAAKLNWLEYRRSGDNVFPLSHVLAGDALSSAMTLADAYIADLAERERREAERALPLDDAFWEGQGSDTRSIFVRNGDVEFEVEKEINGYGVDVTVYDHKNRCVFQTFQIGTITTRGQLLDLLAALGGRKEGE